ncbi:hypothetical protein KIN20_026762 [Parelaphostrongylus tenuis]|uniref:Uncharacterized protein n=1 Tax=Parelaphostrongylus tenuis TaxID=148309 RepID=A0AAD5WDC8_PARTN|nr:hypothetical protein KIN20_026762 [Parelaphostrongylus tenuis]
MRWRDDHRLRAYEHVEKYRVNIHVDVSRLARELAKDLFARNDCDIEFEYNDCDSLLNELAELYTYSELEDFASNIQCWKVYADNNEILPPFHFSSLPMSRKVFIMQDLCARMESAEPDVRLASARIMLYILQGAYLDFCEEEEVEAGMLLTATFDKGTGGHEMGCLHSAFLNAHLAYKTGAYQALCTLLMTEICEPFDSGPGAVSDGGRESKASSRSSRCPSSADLAENDRRNRRAATIADNEAIRTVLSSLYHMVELIRNLDLTDKLSSGDSNLPHRRTAFLAELKEPLDHVGQPLLLVLFEMLPQFYTGSSPHLPIRKVLLLIWKILLATLGGWRELDAQKAAKRTALGLPVMENTIAVASSLPATVVNDNESGARMAARRIVPIGRVMARQLAYAGSDEVKDEEFDISAISCDDSIQDCNGTTKRPGAELRHVCSGERTPRAGSPTLQEPPKQCLPWRSKVSKQEIENFLQQERQKFFSYQLPGDVDTMFALPIPVHRSVETLRKHLYTSLGELQAAQDEDYNRYIFSRKEVIEMNDVEELYRLLLPNLCQYVVALLKILLAAAPSNKAKNDALNILIDVLTPETEGCDILSNSISLDHSTSSPLEESVRLAIDINRHKEIMVKATSSILLLLMKHFRLNHIYQYEYLCQHIVYGNGIPLMLKFLDQNMIRYVQSRYEIHAYNYPQAPLHYVRNREEWPTLNPDNVENGDVVRRGMYYMWRNLFSSINLIRVLNKLVKGKQSRVMMLMVFKSAPILKRSFENSSGIIPILCVESIEDAITLSGSSVEEKYSWLHPQLSIEVSDAPMPGDDYLNRVNLRDFEPVDNCLHSVLGKQPELGKRFKSNYQKWMEDEVLKRNIDWNRLLMNTRGIALSKDVAQ